MNNIEVTITYNDQHGDFKSGDTGTAIGFLRGGDDRPYVVVVLPTGSFVLVATHGVRATHSPIK